MKLSLRGILPNLCYGSPSAQVEVVDNQINVKVQADYSSNHGDFCPEVIVPFEEKIEVGMLDRGEYDILVNQKSRWNMEDKIRVQASQGNALEEDRAHVNHMIQSDDNPNVIYLSGFRPSDCFEIDEIEYVDNGKNSYSLIPRMVQVRGFCPMKMVPFNAEWEIPNDLNADKVLIHVKSLGGKSLQQIIHR